MALRFLAVAGEATLAGAILEQLVASETIVVGRSEDADMVLDDPSVALRHIRIDLVEEGFTVRQLGDHPAWLNGRRLPAGASVPVKPSEVLRLGVYELTFVREEGAPAVPDARSAARALAGRLLAFEDGTGGGPVLQVVNGPEAGKQVAVLHGGRLRLGRGRDCDLIVDDKRVSRLHAFVFRQGGRVWVQDASSINGCKLDGRRLDGQAEMVEGSCLQLGRVKVALRRQLPEVDGWSAALEVVEVHARQRWWVPAGCFGLAVVAAIVAVIAG